MRSLSVVFCLFVSSLLGVGACSSQGDDVEREEKGGTGGNSGSRTGGTANTSQGGSRSGGTTSRGGVTSSGGATSSGGTTASGGTTGSGGTTSSGDTNGTGGRNRPGGRSGNGGATSSGGTAGGGGTTAKGGTPGTGGTGDRGGTTGAGGSTATGTKFSFFVVSYAAIQRIAGSKDGLGGDLRHGETGPGAGLRGADKMCAEIAEGSMAGAGAKQWRAFLSATADENGQQVNAIERIGNGPWYDRLGRLFANNLNELYYDRPSNADPAIRYDFPNEDGVLNQNPDMTGNVDNHDFLTGTNNQGKLYSATSTCSDWTSSAADTSQRPRVGHTWPTNTRDCSTTSTLGGSGTGGTTGAGGRGGFPGGGMGSMCNWMSALDESGCAPGVNLIQNGGPGRDGTVGSGGGYGGFYCFALTP